MERVGAIKGQLTERSFSEHRFAGLRPLGTGLRPPHSELHGSGDREDTERYYHATGTSSRERIKLLKLVWDFVGTEFGGRQLQYEMFDSASQPVVNTRAFRGYDWDHARALVDRCLGEY
jgi:aromatic ring hydroxylase